MDRVENDFGISRQAKMVPHGVIAISSLSDSTLDMKFEIFRSYGLSDATIYRMVGRSSSCVLSSDEKIRKIMNFFINELGFEPDFLATLPVILDLSFEKRVKPRSEVLKVLNRMKLNKRKRGLYSVLCMPESNFVNDYLLTYKDAMPDVYNSYFKLVGRDKAAANRLI
jgi:mTERF domain-containing protein, mitochondrial